jgi:integrase
LTNEPLPLGVTVEHESDGATVTIEVLPNGADLSLGSRSECYGWTLAAADLEQTFVGAPTDFVGIMEPTATLRSASGKLFDRQALHFEWRARKGEQSDKPPGQTTNSETAYVGTAAAHHLRPKPPHVLSYWQAQEAARKLPRRQPGEFVDENRPLTVADALDAYEKDLKTRGASKYNAGRVRRHLTSVLLSKPVALLGATELKKWRDSLNGNGLAPVSVNRTIKALRAALEIAADHDPRITNQRAWKVGLAILPDAAQARNVILSDDEVLRLVAAAYERDARFGLLIDVLATTGARPSQATRLTVGDLKPDPVTPKLNMPRSGKGGSHDRTARKAERYSVPITTTLAGQLVQEAADRPLDAPLLMRSRYSPDEPGGAGLQGNDTQPWDENPSMSYRKDFAEAVAAIGLDPKEVTAYSLRHSSIVRAILANVPIRVVAARHDTSVSMIERNYSRHISEHADQYARQGLLQAASSLADNVIPLAGR